MKKIWTLVASTMLVASVAFAQDDFDDMDQSAEQYTEQEQAEFQAEDQAGEAPEEESSEASTVQNNNQVTNQTNIQQANQVNIQNNYYAQANEAPAEDPIQSRAAESRIGFGIRGAFDYGMMYGFSEEDDDIDQTPRGVGFEGGIIYHIKDRSDCDHNRDHCGHCCYPDRRKAGGDGPGGIEPQPYKKEHHRAA